LAAVTGIRLSEGPIHAADNSSAQLNLASRDIVAFIGGRQRRQRAGVGHLELLVTLAFPTGARSAARVGRPTPCLRSRAK